MVIAPESLSGLNAKQLRELARDLIAQIANRDRHYRMHTQPVIPQYK